MKSHLTGQLSAAFVICEYFHFWHLLKLAEANQAKDFPTTRRLVPTYAQCSIPSIISKSNSGVNPKERSNLRRLCLSWRVSQRGKEWLWLGTQTLVAAFPEPNPIMCTQVWAHTTKEFSHLHIPDSHLQPIKEKTTEKIFIINQAAAAAKSLQSCPTLCDPIDGSPPGSPVPGILQARTLECVAISFSNAWKWKVKVKSFSHVWFSATPKTTAYQAPPSMGFSMQESWSGVPLTYPVNHETNQIKMFLISSSVQFSSVAKSCPTLCDPMNRSTPGLPVHPGVHSDSRPSSQWCHPAFLSYVIPFSSCPQSLPASVSIPMSKLFAWGGQSIGVSASASFIPKKSQGWSSEQTGWISLQSKGLSRVYSNTTVQKHQFFGMQTSLWTNSYIHTWLLQKP